MFKVGFVHKPDEYSSSLYITSHYFENCNAMQCITITHYHYPISDSGLFLSIPYLTCANICTVFAKMKGLIGYVPLGLCCLLMSL